MQWKNKVEIVEMQGWGSTPIVESGYKSVQFSHQINHRVTVTHIFWLFQYTFDDGTQKTKWSIRPRRQGPQVNARHKSISILLNRQTVKKLVALLNEWTTQQKVDESMNNLVQTNHCPAIYEWMTMSNGIYQLYYYNMNNNRNGLFPFVSSNVLIILGVTILE